MLHENKTDQEYYTTLPRKRIGSGVLVFYKNELLIVQPSYASGWILPGGTIEAEESPWEGLVREIQETLGIAIQPNKLLAVDYIHNTDVKGEYISFLFAASDLTESQIRQIRPAKDIIQNYRFVDTETALQLLTPGVSRRVDNALKAHTESEGFAYLEDGRKASPQC